MSREYLKPEIHHEETGPPPDVARLSTAHIRNHELWSNDALFTMISINHPSSEDLRRILEVRSMQGDHVAERLLKQLQEKVDSDVPRN